MNLTYDAIADSAHEVESFLDGLERHGLRLGDYLAEAMLIGGFVHECARVAVLVALCLLIEHLVVLKEVLLSAYSNKVLVRKHEE